MDGLQWAKMDLHVHTWASGCFRKQGLDPAAIAQNIVAHCNAQQIQAIAVTDHNTGGAVDQMKGAAASTGLVIFPGVEVSVAGGKGGTIHVIAVFPPDRGGQDIRDLLTLLNAQVGEGDESTYANCTLLEAMKTVHSRGGLALFPHPGSTKGVSGDFGGQARADVLESPYLAGCEYNEKLHERYPDIPMYEASDGGMKEAGEDAHTVEGIGTRYSWFKVGELTFEALRQCFVDHEARICRSALPPNANPSYIEQVEISGGFLDGLALGFHPGLNSVIGGKGTGKSLLIECLRFALHRSPPSYAHAPEIRADHDTKLKECLTPGGSVTVYLRTDAGRMRVTRTYDGTENPTEVVDLHTGEPAPGDEPWARWPAWFFSQREIAAMVEDGEAQVALLDELMGIETREDSTASLVGELAANDAAIARALLARARLAPIVEDIEAKRARLDTIREQGQSAASLSMDLARARRAAIRDAIGSIERLSALLRQAEAGMEALALPAPSRSEVEEHALVSRAIDLARRAAARALEAVRAAMADAAESCEKANAIERQYAPEFDMALQSYNAELQRLGLDEAKLQVERQQIEVALEELMRSAADDQNVSSSLPELLRYRSELLDQYEAQARACAQRRGERYAAVTEATNSRLRITLSPQSDPRRYLTALRGARTSLHQPTLEAITSSVRPRALVDAVITGDPATLGAVPGTPADSLKRLITNLASDTPPWQELLRWQYALLADDQATIEYGNEQEGYKGLKQLSVGGRSAALTTLVLSRGDGPVVIDQPEDSLDIQSVWEDIVRPLRAQKEQRQFILTTHNSTLAVASDSDAFTLMAADSAHGTISAQGAIEHGEVREAVIRHVEGGPEPYRLKQRKYGQELPRE